MNQTPRPLALLISLIGVSASQLALAQVEGGMAPPVSARAAAGSGLSSGAAPGRPFGTGSTALAAEALGRVRGGFSGGGLDISFGIERAVYLNGVLVTGTTLNVAGVAAFPGAAGVTIENGTGNSAASGSVSRTPAATLIQNTLDGQKLQNLTVINATANSLGIYRNLDLGASLRGAVIDSLHR